MPEMTAAEAAEIERFQKVICWIEYCNNSNRKRLSDADMQTLRTAASILRRVASGEYAPVIHAHWNENWKLTDGRINRDCSACHGRTNDFTETPICPWCGAHMDEPVVIQTQDGKDDSHV